MKHVVKLVSGYDIHYLYPNDKECQWRELTLKANECDEGVRLLIGEEEFVLKDKMDYKGYEITLISYEQFSREFKDIALSSNASKLLQDPLDDVKGYKDFKKDEQEKDPLDDVK